MSKGRKINAEEKIRIVCACLSGDMGVSVATTQLGVDHHTVNDWLRLYETEGLGAFLPWKENRQYDPALKEAV